jgi:hypothetical protein
MLAPMRHAAAVLLVTASFALPSGAGQRSSSFQVGAVVVRSARIRTGAGRIHFTTARPVAVSIDSAAPRLSARDVPLPPGTVRVTVDY